MERRPPRASWWLRLLRWTGMAPEQRTCIWCPRCGLELCSDPASTYTSDGPLVSPLVRYVCSECGLASLWDVSAPVPLLIPVSGVAPQP